MPMLSTIEFKDNNEDFITTFKKIVLEKNLGLKSTCRDCCR